ncbi:MAG: hypothetical protein JO153_14090 [Solirubrobacterales bacterium]|nr:hypothetical protein [Solirubrobacterales bacterium]MBV9917631.1 hypothetical protein [Solirubrobacterales bacterium]
MSFSSGMDGTGRVRWRAITQTAGAHAEERRLAPAGRLGTGTLACSRCDAPVALGGPVSPSAGITCPFCGHGARVRDFLSLALPTRPARVQVRVALARALSRP